jgi:hypothetical protein
MDNTLAAGRRGCISVSAPPGRGLSPVLRRTAGTAQRPKNASRRKAIVERIQPPVQNFGHSFASEHDLLADAPTARTRRHLQRIPKITRVPAPKQDKTRYKGTGEHCALFADAPHKAGAY